MIYDVCVSCEVLQMSYDILGEDEERYEEGRVPDSDWRLRAQQPDAQMRAT